MKKYFPFCTIYRLVDPAATWTYGKALLTAVVVSCVVSFTGVFDHTVWTPDEPRVAEIGRAMAVSADLVVPTLGGEPFLEKPAPEHDKCVRETTYMRHHHWELLRGIREEVVRYGMRGEVGLNGCRDCHTKRERFCDQCHTAVSLTPDCWGCHYYP